MQRNQCIRDFPLLVKIFGTFCEYFAVSFMDSLMNGFNSQSESLILSTASLILFLYDFRSYDYQKCAHSASASR